MMAVPDRIGFLGFGEAAQAFNASLKLGSPEFAFSAYDIKLSGPEAAAMSTAMVQANVAVRESAKALTTANWIISAVTADQSVEAVQPLLPALKSRHLIIDINSVSPSRKKETAEQVCRTGAAYLDMAVMSPVHPRGHKTPVLIAGTRASDVASDLQHLGFDLRVVGAEPGAATAIKMVRSLFVKGLEAITVETLLAAEASGCFDEILSSLSASYPGLGWPEIAAYQFDRTLIHGARRAAEMEESAATLNDLGLTGDLAAAIAAVQKAQGESGAETPADNALKKIVSETLRRRLSRA